jgi:hypothetical protein
MRSIVVTVLLCCTSVLSTARLDTVKVNDGTPSKSNTVRPLWEESAILAPNGPCVVKQIQIHYAAGSGADTIYLASDAAEGAIPPTQYSWSYGTYTGPVVTTAQAGTWMTLDVSDRNIRLGGFDRIVVQHRMRTGGPTWSMDASQNTSTSFVYDPVTPNPNFFNIPGIYYLAGGDYLVRVLVEYELPHPGVGTLPRPVQLFTDVTVESGLVDANGKPLVTTNVSAVDVNGDGHDDIVIGSALFLHQQNNTFKATSWPISGSGTVWADIDGDGDQDCFAVNGFNNDKTWRNDGNVTFTDITAATGLANNAPTVTPLWLDIENDGDMDLFIANGRTEQSGQEVYFQDRLFRNDNGVFTNITTPSGIAAGEPSPYYDTWAASLCDYNHDGRTDIFVATYRLAPDRLYRNNGDGTFTEVSAPTGVIGVPTSVANYYGHGMGSDWGDWDGDGDVDLAVGNLGHPDSRAQYSNPSLLWRNDGGTQWKFTNDAKRAGLHFFEMNAGMAFGDYDLDGDLDLWHGQISYEARGQGATRRSRLYRTDKSGNEPVLTDITWESMDIHGAWCAARLDFDDDGDLDLVVASDKEYVKLYRNDMPGTGASATVDAGPSTITVYAGGSTIMRQVPGSIIGGRASQHTSRQIIGIGNATVADSIRIVPFGSNTAQVLRDVAPNNVVGRTTRINETPRQIAPANGSVQSGSTFDLRWHSASGPWHVIVARDAAFTSIVLDSDLVTTSTLTLPAGHAATPAPGEARYWRVRRSGFNSGPWTGVWWFSNGSVAPGMTTKIAPSNNREHVSTKPTFTWRKAAYAAPPRIDATRYTVRVTDIDADPPSVVATRTTSDTAVSDIELGPLRRYSWTVSAENNGSSGPLEEAWQFVTYGAPAAPELSYPADGVSDVELRPRFTWYGEVSSETYQLEYDTVSTFTSATRKSPRDTFAVTIAALKPNRTYHWRVRGVNLVGEGAWSAVRLFTTALSTSVNDTDVPGSMDCDDEPILYTILGQQVTEADRTGVYVLVSRCSRKVIIVP